MTETNSSMDRIHHRLGMLEQENASINSDIKNIVSAVRDLASDVKAIKDGSRTNWGMLAAWATVIIAIMVYHSSLTMEPLKHALEDHESWKAHPFVLERHAKTEERSKRFENKLIELDIDLQREMRDVAKVNEVTIKSLDTMLQREIRLINATTLENISAVSDRVSNLEESIHHHQNTNGHPYLQEKMLESIEKRLERLEGEE
jgi:hypothetical protein